MTTPESLNQSFSDSGRLAMKLNYGLKAKAAICTLITAITALRVIKMKTTMQGVLVLGLLTLGVVTLGVATPGWAWGPNEGIENSENGEHFFRAACRLGHKEAFEYYVNSTDFDVNDYLPSPNENEPAKTGLYIAIEHSQVEIVKMFLAQPDIDLTIGVEDGESAQSIVEANPDEEIKTLIAEYQQRVTAGHEQQRTTPDGSSNEDDEREDDEREEENESGSIRQPQSPVPAKHMADSPLDSPSISPSISTEGLSQNSIPGSPALQRQRSSSEESTQSTPDTAVVQPSEQLIVKPQEETQPHPPRVLQRQGSVGTVVEETVQKTVHWAEQGSNDEPAKEDMEEEEDADSDTNAAPASLTFNQIRAKFSPQKATPHLEETASPDPTPSQLVDTLTQQMSAIGLTEPVTVPDTPYASFSTLLQWQQQSTLMTNRLMVKLAEDLKQELDKRQRQLESTQNDLGNTYSQLESANRELDNLHMKAREKAAEQARIDALLGSDAPLEFIDTDEFTGQPLEKKDGENLFVTACATGHTEAASQLANNNPELVNHPFPHTPPGTSNSGTATGLFIAAENGHEPVVENLLEEGADATIGASTGETPLSVATLNHHWGIVDTLKEPSDFAKIEDYSPVRSRSDKQIIKAFWLACQTNDHDTVRQMLSRDLIAVDYSHTTRRGMRVRVETGLQIAARYGHKKTVDTLLEYNADPAVILGRLIIKDGTSFQVDPTPDTTPLVLASKFNNGAVVDSLLARLEPEGEEVDETDYVQEAQAQSINAAVIEALKKSHFQMLSKLHGFTGPSYQQQAASFETDMRSLHGLQAYQLLWRDHLRRCIKPGCEGVNGDLMFSPNQPPAFEAPVPYTRAGK